MNNVIIDFRTGNVYACSDEDEGKALEIFVNLQTPNTIKKLEEEVRNVLQGKEEKYESIDEHTQIFVNNAETHVKSFIPTENKEPITNSYPTFDVYWLLCKYNIIYDNMEKIKNGLDGVTNPEEELQQRIDLVKEENGKTKV